MKTEKTTPKKIWFCNAVRSVLALALIASSLTFSADAEAATRRKGGRKSSAKVTAVSKSSKKSNKSKSTDRIVKTIAALISEATPAPISTSAPAVAKTEAEFFELTSDDVKDLFPTTGEDIVGKPQFAIAAPEKSETLNVNDPVVVDSGEVCPSDEEVATCLQENASSPGAEDEVCTEITEPISDDVENAYQQCVAEGGAEDECAEGARSATAENALEYVTAAVFPDEESGQVAKDDKGKIPTFEELFPGKKPSDSPPVIKPGEGKIYVCGSAESLRKCIKAGCKNDLRWNNGVPVRQGGQYELGSFDCRTMGSVGAYICNQRGMKSCIVYNDGMHHAMFGVLMVENGKQVWKVVDWRLNVREWRRGDYAVCNTDGGLFIPIGDGITKDKLPPIMPGFGPKDQPAPEQKPKKD
jgi:hypothetical protein